MAISPKSRKEMEAATDWQPWAAQGWTLQQTATARFWAVNQTARLATDQAKTFDTLLKYLANGHFNYGYFMAFKKLVDSANQK
jgi:hypothetical protein